LNGRAVLAIGQVASGELTASGLAKALTLFAALENKELEYK